MNLPSIASQRIWLCENPEEFKGLLKWMLTSISRKGTKYPATFITGGLNDQSNTMDAYKLPPN
jgi:hypothetical protein